jgi:glyoxylase-like metal-dependent hydrolase (beta-lactamase superfamily II)
MVKRERVANNVYIFQSKEYAQVNAGLVVGPDMAVIIDTLAFPEETIIMRDFVEQELQIPIRYVINTHYHADHAWGNMFFPGAIIMAHRLCYEALVKHGIPSMVQARKNNKALKNVKIVLPTLLFDEGELGIQVGKKTLKLFSLPGHTSDNIAVVIEEDRVMFSGDTIMPLPYIVDGDIDQMITSLKKVAKMPLENIVQGHGDIILRGEVVRVANENQDYLSQIRKAVRKASRRKYPLDLLETYDVESCGKSRVLLDGLAEELHHNNLMALYHQIIGKEPEGSELYFMD